MKQQSAGKIKRKNVLRDQEANDSDRETSDARLLHNLAFCFEVTNAVIVVILLIFSWCFKDPQSLIIPSVMGLVGMPVIDISRRYFAKGMIHEGITGASLASWLTALVIGFFASVVPVIFAASSFISLVPVIIAAPTVPSRLLFFITGMSTLICGVCAFFLLMPPFLAEGVPADVIETLVAVMVPVILALLSVALWFGHNRLKLSLETAQEVNKALAEQHRLEKELEEQRYLEERSRLNAERASLETLRYQLNPHFLFNSLASIRGALSEDIEVAHEMVTALSDFCRLSLTRGAIEVQSLEYELESVQLYLRIEQIRSGDDLQVNLSVSQDLGQFMMPAFVLQPLVENSIKYGRRTSPEPLKFELQISPTEQIVQENRESENGLYISVSNTGTWFDTSKAPGSLSTGTGLRNLRQRLYSFYGEEARLSHRESDGWVHVDVWLPFEITQN